MGSAGGIEPHDITSSVIVEEARFTPSPAPPTPAPTEAPTTKPTQAATNEPTSSPTRTPTEAPTMKPTGVTPSPSSRPNRQTCEAVVFEHCDYSGWSLALGRGEYNRQEFEALGG